MLSLLLSKTGLTIIGVLSALTILGFIGYKIEAHGYNRAVVIEEAKYTKILNDINEKTLIETNRQDEVAEKLNKLQNQQIADLLAKSKEDDEIQKENEIEAAKDPNADAPAIGTNSVLRLNRIK